MSHPAIYGSPLFRFFFFNDPAPTELYTLSLHDALPICPSSTALSSILRTGRSLSEPPGFRDSILANRSEEHTSELQSRVDLVCRLLLEKKKRSNQLRFHAENWPKKQVQYRIALPSRDIT